MVLRFSNDMMSFRCSRNVLTLRSSSLLMPSMNTANTSLVTFDLCQLLDKTFATGALISGFGTSMLQFSLKLTDQCFQSLEFHATNWFCREGVHGTNLSYGLHVVTKRMKLICVDIKGLATSL